MIQFNLLPDVKIEFIKTQRLRRTIFLVSILVTVVSVGLLAIQFMTVGVYQKVKLNSLSKEIAQSSKKLQDTPDLNKILTVQNQLNSLQGQHDKKVIASRLPKFLDKVTPSNVSINKLDVDFTTQTLIFAGKSDNLVNINKFVDTLKFTNYQRTGSEDTTKAFVSVVLEAFAKDVTGGGVTYTIKATYDPVIFSTIQPDANTAEGSLNQQDAIALNVLNIITTRSETEKPGVFQPNSRGGN